jgi:hypothetical protein
LKTETPINRLPTTPAVVFIPLPLKDDTGLGSSKRAQDSDPDRVALRERSIRQHLFIQEAQLHGNGRQTSPPVSA